MHKIQVKNMVCPRCINSVRNILTELDIPYNSIQLGEVELVDELSSEQKQTLNQQMNAIGFELLDDKESRIINSIKTFLVEMIHYDKHQSNKNISEVLSKHAQKEYSTLSKLFSKVEGITIEKYIMYQKIEKIKELLSYDEMSISEIAFSLNYSSVSHLSNQFKKVTGISPSEFKKLNKKNRKTIDNI